ncbi:hypothetical protein GYA27_01565 [candidate division WWE3 bacterium]|uniref:Uncharacterized protein n=1 Tax=candidate division WWE3 bacterium TaxID=2053526 RepID=A0A7X9HGG7_UNCKA|nr:hypothetical protein [candidate division WWE3 bacterium]
MLTAVCVYLGVFAIFATVVIVVIAKQLAEGKRLREQLAKYQHTYLYKSGWCYDVGNYLLFSPDGGISWHALNRNSGTGGLDILGTAEEIYPGLLNHLEGMEKLTAYVKKHGPIGAQGKITDSDLLMLSGAGLSVHSLK